MKMWSPVRGAICATLAVAASACSSAGHPSTYVPRDPALRSSEYYFYPAADHESRRALIVFFGNDVAFWAPHQDLAWSLSRDGFDVVGVDLRRFLGALPESEPQRDSAFSAVMPPLFEELRHELHAESLPVVLAGHSFGAEAALWLAARQPPARLAGIVALSPRAAGHLVITARDLLNQEPSGRWAFSTIDAVHTLPPTVRVALVRGQSDPFRMHDSAFVSAGGNRLRRYLIPFAGHSLRKLLVATPMVIAAAEYVAGAPAGARRAADPTRPSTRAELKGPDSIHRATQRPKA